MYVSYEILGFWAVIVKTAIKIARYLHEYQRYW